MAIRPEPKTAMRLQPGVVQAVALLSLSNAALTARLAAEAEGNPALRLVPPEGIWAARPLFDPEGIMAPAGGLVAHVLAEIGLLRLTARERVLALILTEALEPTGWLGTPPARLARDSGVAEAELLAVLSRLQGIEPAGIFARDLAECLRLQTMGETGPDPAMEALLSRLPLLASGGAEAVAAEAGLPADAVTRAARRLRSCDPKPGLRFQGPMPVVPPDLRFTCTQGKWRAELHPAAPQLALADVAGGDIRAARLTIAAVARRRDGILSVAAVMARVQGAYLAGETPDAAPLTSARIAGETGLHRATVNRIAAALTVETPRGTMPLRALLARPVREGGPTADRIRARLAQLLSGPPLSDAALARRLGAEGLCVARRTVTKYRHAMTGRVG